MDGHPSCPYAPSCVSRGTAPSWTQGLVPAGHLPRAHISPPPWPRLHKPCPCNRPLGKEQGGDPQRVPVGSQTPPAFVAEPELTAVSSPCSAVPLQTPGQLCSSAIRARTRRRQGAGGGAPLSAIVIAGCRDAFALLPGELWD